ncbi:MAG: tetratricopeptide repeat protein [Tannerellaceae bacterium]|nr:tetratricopeptide repeat protein [Tannerellaceae bacterium]
MKRIVLLMMICSVSLVVSAQKNTPKWMDKARKAVVKITTYDQDDRRLGEGYGVFVSETGDILSGYTLFKGAYRGVVTDFEEKEYPVTHIVGADELYDVIKIRVSVPKKVSFLQIAAGPVSQDQTAYQLLYSPAKEMNFKQGTITDVSPLKEIYSYYQLGFPLENGTVNTPLVNSNGDVFGLAQEDASGKNELFYAVSAAYTNSLVQGSLDIFNSTYRNIGIRKAWTTNPEDAAIALFLLSSQQDVETYQATINDFIATFPTLPDGYRNRASFYVSRKAELAGTPAGQQKYLDMAKADFEKALQLTPKKDEALYEQAKMIYGVVLDDPELQHPDWTLDKALELIQKAIQADDQPVYHQLAGDIYMYQGEFENAYNSYMIVNGSDLASPSSYYWASKALENIQGSNIGDMLTLLDKAIELSGTSAEAGPFLLERIDKRLMLSQYDEAIEDYDTYYYVVNGQVNDTFYYLREQVKFRKGDLEGSLEDIQQAITLDPENPNYLAEEASVYTRMQRYDDALNSIDKALILAPDFAACYRLRGVCYSRLKKQDEACEAFQKAQELGDPVAEKLIKDNCQ